MFHNNFFGRTDQNLRNGVFGFRTHISFGTVDVRKQRQCVDGKESACTSRKRYEVEDILIHEDYITGSLMNDIALIRLTEDVKFDGMTGSANHY